MDWDKLRIFHAVADAGSLTHAGDTLHLSQSAVSRQIRALEEALNTTLFHRHARGLILTEQGELLFDATKSMNKRLEAASARIRDSEEEVFGELRVTTTTGFGTLWLAPRLPKLYEQYPDLKIDLMLEERVLDLPMREADVAIRMKEPSQADLIRKRLMSVRMRLYASQEYLDKNGQINDITELSKHRLICQSLNSIQVAAGATLVQHLILVCCRASLTVSAWASCRTMSPKTSPIWSAYCQILSQARFRFSSLIRKNCANRKEFQLFGILFRKRSLPIGARCAKRQSYRKTPLPQPLTGKYTHKMQGSYLLAPVSYACNT